MRARAAHGPPALHPSPIWGSRVDSVHVSASAQVAERAGNNIVNNAAIALPDLSAETLRLHDNYLQSFPSTQEVIQTTNVVDHVHRQVQIVLQMWTSNDSNVLATLAAEQRQDDVEIKKFCRKEKALELTWKPGADSIAFNLNLKRIPGDPLERTKRPIKPGALKTVISVFNPLGIVTPITIAAKGILQATQKLSIDWDDEIADDIHKKWLSWLEKLQKLCSLQIPY
ncbi:hypothetical protein EVAR_19209_1 [Eumeta japonica]|uniref:Uncharacterized protein n=1 Tax=Eumeta variegata TaxID=151549 RepID=A0A4C1VEV1_EUMVA|nr:hypothetical protein EVAR_19209_1 [Eumeta japonica]